MREQKVLLEDARQQQEQMTAQFGLLLSELKSKKTEKVEGIEMQTPPLARGEADETNRQVGQGNV